MNSMRYVTDFADQAVILPVFAVTVAMAALAGWWRGALVWACVVGATLLAVLVCKTLLFSCGAAWTGSTFHSPSGHTAAAAAVYGGLVATVTYRAGGRFAWTVTAAAVIALLVGTSRLALDLHTVPDVVAGGLLGTAGAVGVALLAGPPPPRLRFNALGVFVVAVALVLHGTHMPAEAMIQDAGFWIAPALGCVE